MPVPLISHILHSYPCGLYTFPFCCLFARSYSFERRGSDASLHSLPIMRRGSITGPGSDSGHRSLGGGWAGSSAESDTGSSIYGYQGGRRGSEGSIYSLRDIDIPPIFQLSLVDQSLQAGKKVVFSVMGELICIMTVLVHVVMLLSKNEYLLTANVTIIARASINTSLLVLGN